MADRLLGAIPNGTSFLITSLLDTASFLNSITNPDLSVDYFWDTDLSHNTTPYHIPVFTADGALGAVSIQDQTNGGYLGLGTGTKLDILVNVAGNNNLRIAQLLAAPWWPPDTFLSGVNYAIYTGTTGTAPAKIYNNLNRTTTATANNLLTVSLNWYFACTNSSAGNQVNQAEVLPVWICMINSNNPVCSTIQTVPGGFTNIPDCQNGVNYTYCGIGNTCGTTNNCNGPCSEEWYDCLPFLNNNFTCVFDPSKFIFDSQWWTSPYFYALVAVVAVLIIIFIVMVIYAMKQ